MLLAVPRGSIAIGVFAITQPAHALSYSAITTGKDDGIPTL